MQVWYDHEIIAEHPPESRRQHPVDGSLVIIEPDGRAVQYGPGKWHAAGKDVICAFLEPRDDCPRCHPELAR